MNNCKNSNTKDEAILSSADGFTAFSFGGYNIRFRAPYSLERYVDVVKWDDGYLVVLAKYSHNAEPEEEYIDLKPILEGLYIDSASFLKSIKSVRIAYAWATRMLRVINAQNEEIVQFLWNNDGNIGDFCYFCKA